MTAVPAVRDVAKRLRYAPDRVLHERRRARACRRILELRLRAPPRLLFLCYGNICRSPFAAAAMALTLPEGTGGGGIHSVGFYGPGRPSTDTAIAAALRRGVDLSAHRSQLVTEQLVLAVDCIFVMEPRQRTELSKLLDGVERPVLVLGDLDPSRVAQRRILDPYGKDDGFFDSTFRRIERCVGSVADLLWEEKG